MSELEPSKIFPPVEETDESGLLALGGRLEPDWLLDAYSHGIFPWPFSDDDGPMAWWSLDPRAVIPLDTFHVSRRLRRTVRSGQFKVTTDQDFPGVIAACATAPGRVGETWITPDMIEAYVRLFEMGYAHSVETWQGEELVGGTYGVAIGGLFAAESKFHVQRDASKVALVHLVEHLKRLGYVLLDIQQLTPHSTQFGAIEIPREAYLGQLATALCENPAPWRGQLGS